MDERAVASGDEEDGGARPGVPACRLRQTNERLGCGPDGPGPRPRHLDQRRPPWRAGHRAGRDLAYRGVLCAALRPPAAPVRRRVDARAAAAVPVDVDAAVDECLQQDQQHAEEDRKNGDGHVGLQVPLLQQTKTMVNSKSQMAKQMMMKRLN